MLWLLKYYGHEDVVLLNGGRAKWVAEGRPQTSDVPRYPATSYVVAAPALRALRDQVLKSVLERSAVLVDVRSPKEFSGERLAPANLPQEGAQRGGHILKKGRKPVRNVVRGAYSVRRSQATGYVPRRESGAWVYHSRNARLPARRHRCQPA